MSRTSDVIKEEVGFISGAKDYLLSLEGLPSVKVNDIITNEKGNRALVLGLNEDRVQALLLDRAQVFAGDRFTVFGHHLQFPFGEHLFGRVLNALGDPLDGGSSFPPGNHILELEAKAQGINARTDIDEQFKTGVALMDTLLPIGKGQRQLIVGPFGSGKQLFLQDAVRSQLESDMICVYALVGKPTVYIQETLMRLFAKKENGSRVIVLAALSSESAPMIFITPSVALSIAEHFSQKGKDVLVVLDDLGSHARYLREIELLAGRIPGRESYPGDIFYQHAHVMERAGRFNKEAGCGSITLLPVLETNIEELTDLIATNIMAATDGHTFFSAELNAAGHYPAVAHAESVTRVGRKTQSRLHNELSIRTQTLLADYERQKIYSRFGAQLSKENQQVIEQGEVMGVLLKQELFTPIAIPLQIMLLSLAFTSFAMKSGAPFVERNKQNILRVLRSNRELEAVRKSAERGTMKLDRFIQALDKLSLDPLEKACRQLTKN